MIIWLFDFLNIFDLLTFVTFSRYSTNQPRQSTLCQLLPIWNIFFSIYYTMLHNLYYRYYSTKCTNSEVALKKYAHFVKCFQTLINTLYTICINVCKYQISTSFNFTVRQTRFEKFMNSSFIIRNVIASFINIKHFLDKLYVRIRPRTPFLLFLSPQLLLLLWKLLEALQIPWYSEANMRQIAILNHPE